MPLVNVKLIDGVFTDAQKARIISDLTDAMVRIEGENLRPVTWVVIEEVAGGNWAIGGKPLAAADVLGHGAGSRRVEVRTTIEYEGGPEVGVDIGAHLPLIDFGDGPLTAADLTSYARSCVDLNYAAIAANDHLVFPRPWLDGLTALAAVAGGSGTLTLTTTVAQPVVRGPALLAKALASLDVLSGGRVVAALGPGSSPLDYAAVGLGFEERWARLDEAVPAMRALWRGETLRRALLLDARHHDGTCTKPVGRAARVAGKLGLCGWVASGSADR